MSSHSIRRYAVLLAAILIAATGFKAIAGNGDSSGHDLVGVFADASPLERGSQVRLQGVPVGSIKGIELRDGKAWVTTDVDASSLALHADARMTIKPVNLLGEDYIDIEPGTDSKPLLRNGVVPVAQTSSAVTLQQVLDTLDDPTSTALAATIATLGQGLDRSGAETADAIRALAPAMGNTARLGTILRSQNTVLAQLLDRVRPISGALAQQNGKVLDDLVTHTEQLLTAVASQQDAADATLAQLPSTLAVARRTLSNLAGVTDATTPTLKELRPLTDNLSSVATELNNFGGAADPALSSLTPVLDHARMLLNKAAPVVAALQAAGPSLDDTTGRLRPLGRELLDRHLGDLMAFVKKWALSTNGKDALSHYFRGVFHVTPNTLEDLAASILPAKSAGTVATKAPGSGGLGLPDLGGTLNQLGLGQSVGGLLNNLLGGKKTADPNSATGLSQQQEKSLLGQLLGGL